MKLLPSGSKTAAPTDLEILDAIYDRYYSTFANYSMGDAERASKIYVPIDIDVIAEELGIDADIVFGRLYYDLNQRYGYRKDDGAMVHFFANRLTADEIHSINFTYLASVVANLRDDDRKYRTATLMAFWSLVIAIVSFVVSLTAGGS